MTTPRSLEAYPIDLGNDSRLEVNSDGAVILVDCDGYCATFDEGLASPILEFHDGEIQRICLYASDVLALIDEYTLNTTANELRKELAEVRELLRDARDLIVDHEETIAQLRQADTVRPVVDAAAVWDEGYEAGTNEATHCGTIEVNPYR